MDWYCEWSGSLGQLVEIAWARPKIESGGKLTLTLTPVPVPPLKLITAPQLRRHEVTVAAPVAWLVVATPPRGA